MEWRLPDTSKIVTLTGWEPTRSLHEILDDVLAWERRRGEVVRLHDPGPPGPEAPVATAETRWGRLSPP
jgi:hypothetical protein